MTDRFCLDCANQGKVLNPKWAAWPEWYRNSPGHRYPYDEFERLHGPRFIPCLACVREGVAAEVMVVSPVPVELVSEVLR